MIDALGHDSRSEYVEIFWLPMIGPSCTLAARRLPAWLDAEPAGFKVSVSCLASSLGLGSALGRNAPVNRTLGRLVEFGIARIDGKAFAVRRLFPPLAARQITRIPDHLAELHASQLEGTTTVAAAMAVFVAGHRPTRLITNDPGAAAAVLGITVTAGGAVPSTPVIEQLELSTDPSDDGAITVMDAGRIEQLPGPEERTITVAVVRGPCYLALRPLVGAGGPQPDGIVLVREPGRSLTATDVEDVTGVPVFATVDVSPIVARTIDAGLLVARLRHLDEPARPQPARMAL